MGGGGKYPGFFSIFIFSLSHREGGKGGTKSGIIWELFADPQPPSNIIPCQQQTIGSKFFKNEVPLGFAELFAIFYTN
jgi:hypothetical protein